MPEYPLPVLSLKSGHKKVRRRKKKKDKKEYQKSKRKAIRRGIGILEVSVYLYEIYK